jgi:adenosine deaminase
MTRERCSFFPLFSKYIYQLCDSKRSVQRSTASVLRDFRDDGVAYLELRTIPRQCKDLTKQEYVATVLDCIDDSPREAMSTYLILSIDRKHTAAQAMEVVDMAIGFKDRGVVGVDLCGNPTKGDASLFREAFSKAREHNLKITLHFAEVPQSSGDEELRTLLSYGPDRLGHVIKVSEAIKQEIIKRRLGLELCLTCNVNARMIAGSFADHHFGYWKDRGCPIMICVSLYLSIRSHAPDARQTDDMGIFCSPPSQEHMLLAQHFGLERPHLGQLCANAVGSIFGPPDEQVRLHHLLQEFAAASSGH